MLAYLNGSYVPRASASVSAEDRGFVFGDGVYEVWRVVNGRLFEAERHLARLESGLRELRIAAPDIVAAPRLLEVAEQLLRGSNLLGGEATLYLEITRGAAPRTHQFPPVGVPPTVYASVNRLTPPEELRARGAACITVSDIRWLRCDIKSLQLLPNVMAKQAAVERGALDAIMIRDGVVTEGSHTSVMAIVDGVLRTHPTNHLILPGITRAVVLELAAGLGIRVRVREEALSESELRSADELFLVGTTTDVMPVVRLDDATVGNGKPGAITMKLSKAFRSYLDAACSAAQAAS